MMGKDGPKPAMRGKAVRKDETLGPGPGGYTPSTRMNKTNIKNYQPNQSMRS